MDIETEKKSSLVSNLLIISIYGISLWILCVAFSGFYSWDKDYVDAKAYFDAGKKILLHHPLYSSYGQPGGAEKLFLYTPIVAILMVPFTLVEPLLGYALWMGVHLLLIFSIFRSITIRLNISQEKKFLIAILSFSILNPYLFSELKEGQMNLIIIWLILISNIQEQKNNTFLSSLCLSLAIFIKLQSLVFLLIYIINKKWRMLFSVLIWVIIFLIIPIIFVTSEFRNYMFQQYISYFNTILMPLFGSGYIAGREEYFITNNSSLAVLSRLFLSTRFWPFPGSEHIHGPLITLFSEWFVKLIANLINILIIVVSINVARKKSNYFIQHLMRTGILYIGVQLSSPTFWEHHALSLIFLIIPLYMLAIKNDKVKLKALVLYFFALISFSGLNLVLVNNQIANLIYISRVYGLPTLGVLAIWILAVKYSDQNFNL